MQLVHVVVCGKGCCERGRALFSVDRVCADAASKRADNDGSDVGAGHERGEIELVPVVQVQIAGAAREEQHAPRCHRDGPGGAAFACGKVSVPMRCPPA
jgi:hypothetical protein